MFLSPQDACILLLLFMVHLLNFVTSAIIKSQNPIQANICDQWCSLKFLIDQADFEIFNRSGRLWNSCVVLTALLGWLLYYGILIQADFEIFNRSGRLWNSCVVLTVLLGWLLYYGILILLYQILLSGDARTLTDAWNSIKFTNFKCPMQPTGSMLAF